MKDKVIGALIWCVIILILVGCNRILNYPYSSGDYGYMDEETRQELQEEINEEARQKFIEEQLF